MNENKITFPVKLASNNPKSFGIVDAAEISGHRSVEALSDLYAISDSILSILKDGSDAIGQEWFVVSEDCKYRLDNWGNRRSVAGWTKLPKQEFVNTKQSISEKDQPNGYAGLDSNGKLPIEKTYGATATVVDVATYESLPATGLNGVIYYVSNTSAQYKWSGSSYVDITDGADNAKKNETSIFDCSNGTSTKYYSSLSDAINVVPPVYRTSNRIISYLSTENATTIAVNYQYHGIDSTTWTDLTKWERIPNQADLAGIRAIGNKNVGYLNNFFHLEKGKVVEYSIYFPFKAGTKLRMIVSNYYTTYTTGGDWNINIEYTHNGSRKFLHVHYGREVNDIVDAVFEDDTDYITVFLGSNSSVTTASVDLSFLYGNSLLKLSDDTSNANKATEFAIAINKNDGNESTPNYRPIVERIVIPPATSEKAGVMSSADKVALDTIIDKVNQGGIDYAINETLSINGTSTKNISGPFKAGQKLLLYTTNFICNGPSGYGQVRVKNTQEVTLFSNIYIEGEFERIGEYTLIEDTDILSVVLAIASPATSASADVILAIDDIQIDKFKTNKCYSKLGIIDSNENRFQSHVISDLNIVYSGQKYKTKKILGDFRQGTSIEIYCTEFTTPSSGDCNAQVNVHFTDNTTTRAALFYRGVTGKTIYTFEKDADYIIIELGTLPSTTDFNVRFKLRYGSFLNEVSEIKQIANNAGQSVENINGAINVEKITHIQQAGEITEWVYRNFIVGYNKPFVKDCVLKSLTIYMYDVSASAVGQTRKLYVGTVDQRNWLLVDQEYDVEVISYNGSNVIFDLQGISVKAGQVVFLEANSFSTSQPTVGYGYSNAAYDENAQLAYTSNLNYALTYPSYGLVNFKLEILEIESVFLPKVYAAEFEESIAALHQETNKINSFTDVVTNEPYKIKIINGQVVAQSLNFKRILTISHSYSIYANSPSADWYLPEGQIRAMAPSVYDNEWAAFLAEKYGATVTKKGGVDFERACDPDFNFAANWNIQDNYDAICVYLCENVPAYYPEMQEAWENMLRYLKSAAPHAEIYCTAGWGGGQKAMAIAAACASVPDIGYVNLVGIDSNGSMSWNVGDYYIGRDNKYLPMGAPNGHPSDIGHLTIANKFLEKIGQLPFDNKTKMLTLNQVGGGIISTRNLEQVIGAVVSVKCIADSGKYINGMTAIDGNGNNIEVTLRVNGLDINNPNIYYTFTMPNSDVTITPIWSKTKGYTTYTTTVSDISGGTIKNLNSICLAGTRCFFYVKPSSGHSLNSISATAGGNTLTLTPDGENCYYFDMPSANVTITPIWN